ncbi:hypothetical protein [Aliikangiella sp. IMCC44359]|uniref:hypothetical protein n=1 Tax=Aliikangiella sp. IMCC44359 TaxID=3459125 RepID=UPI00403B1836
MSRKKQFDLKGLFFASLLSAITACGGSGGGNNVDQNNNVVITDTTPDSFAFEVKTGVERSTEIESAEVLISGIDAAASVSITGGSYSIDNGEFSDQASTVNNSQSIKVRVISSELTTTTTTATITIGGVSADFSVTTNDPVPDDFSLSPQSMVQLNEEVTSAPISITGIDTPIAISVSGGSYQIDGGAFTDQAGTISNNQSVVVKSVASDQYSTVTTATLTVGTLSADFTVTTNELNYYYFAGSTPTSGTELWKSDGTEAGTTMVKEINVIGHSDPEHFTEVGTTVFFTAKSYTSGVELWKSDANGVALVKDIYPEGDSHPKNLVAGDNVLYFTANDSTTNNSLWKSDGTSSGTIKVTTESNVSDLTIMPDGSLYYVISDQLYRYDGTNQTVISPTPAISSVARLTAVGNKLYFSAVSSATGNELWASDGTNAGTQLVKDLSAGTSSFFGNYNKLFNVKGKLVFSDSNYHSNLYVSDGTEAGTVQLMSDDATPVAIRAYNHNNIRQADNSDVYFINYSGYHIWQTDGSSVGTKEFDSSNILVDIYEVQQTADEKTVISTRRGLWVSSTSEKLRLTTTQTSFVTLGDSIIYKEDNELKLSDGLMVGESFKTLQDDRYLKLYNGTNQVYLSYDNKDGKGREPWVTDGSDVGTKLLLDINDVPSGSSNPYESIVFKDAVYFTAEDGIDGYILWKTDGTDEGTQRVTPEGVSNVYHLTESNGRLYFSARDTAHGNELWVSDGDLENTQLFYDLEPGERSSGINFIQDFNDVLYFSANSYDLLLKTTGTVDSVSIAGFVSPESNQSYIIGNKMFFSATVSDDKKISQKALDGYELWVTDGTPSGTHVVKDINPDGSGIYRHNLVATTLGNILYFIADDGVNGYELWKTDGTEENTQMVIDFNGTEDGMSNNNSRLITWNNSIYFNVYNEFEEFELWKSDGTTEGTVQVTNFGSIGGVDLYSYAVFDNHIYFPAYTENEGSELWKTDGTSAGTIMVKDIEPGEEDSSPDGLYVFNNILFFNARDEVHGRELWKSDGTEAGTILVKDVNEGVESGSYCIGLFGCNFDND